MRERTVERNHVQAVKDAGGQSYKFKSPGQVAVPDRIDFYPIPKRHQVVVAKYVVLTELKRPGQKPRVYQQVIHDRFKAMGFKVQVIDK